MGAEMGESVGVAMVVAEREKLPKRTRTRALDTPSRDPVSAAVALTRTECTTAIHLVLREHLGRTFYPRTFKRTNELDYSFLSAPF